MSSPLHRLASIGRFCANLHQAAAVTYNGSREGVDWFFKIHRLYVEAYTKRHFPDCYAQLDGGDIRMMTAFLEPESLSNTYSLLAGSGALAPESEFLLSPREAWEYLLDMFGPLARHDSPFVVADAAARQGGERWFYINGIINGRARAQRSAGALKAAFARDFIVVHNPTQGLVHDIVESALEKFTNTNTEVVARAFLEIASALLDPSVAKVAVVAHSQGTIITGDVLDLIYAGIDERYLDRTNMNDGDVASFRAFSYGTIHSYEIRRLMDQLQNKAEMVARKLELYMFANAASRMCYLFPDQCLPHIESYANEHDIVARLGVLARDEFHEEDLVRIDGPVFTSNRYGHQFGAHYLPGFLAGQYELLPACKGPCIGDSVHDPVRGNPCAKNPLRTPGPIQSRLSGHLRKGPESAALMSQPSNGARPQPSTVSTQANVMRAMMANTRQPADT